MTTFNQYRFIFLCGLHRSGTSPLFRILRGHGQISGFRNSGVPEDEGQHLQTVYPAAKCWGGPGLFGFAPEAHLTEQSPVVSAQNGQKLFDEWSRHWDMTKPYLLEKSPPNLIQTRFLQALFPNSYFLVISRHPIAVSLATWKWTNAGLESLVEHWLHCHRLFEQDRRRLKRVYLLKYEDLIRDTEGELGKIYKLLGLHFSPPPPMNPGGNDSYFKTWRELSRDRKGQQIVERILSKFEPEVQSYGYSLVDCEARTSAHFARDVR